MNKITEKSLVPLKRNIANVAEQVSFLEINNSKDMTEATKILSVLNKYADSVKDKKETITKPLNQALKSARLMFKPIEDIYDEAISMLRSKMSAYQTEQVRLANEEKAKIAARVGEGKGHLKIETAVAKIENIETPADNIATDVGDVKFRETKQLKIVDAFLIPRDYLLIDEKKILNDLKEGKTVPGCEVEIIQVPVNYR